MSSKETRSGFTEIKLKSGKISWEYVEDGPPHPVTRKRNQITRRGRTQTIAKKRVHDEIRRLEDHGVNQRVTKNMTFEWVATKWYDMYKQTGKKSTTIDKKARDIKPLNEKMANHPIGLVTHFLYQNVLNELSHSYATSTLRGIHGVAKQIFSYAVRNKWMKENPTIDVEFPKKVKTIEEIRQDSIEEKYFNREELEEFLSTAIEHGLKYDKERFFTLAFSGMRSGELCALQKGDLLFDANEISIWKTIYSPKNNMREYILTTPKTDKSVRVISMEPFVMDMLKKLVRQNDEHKMKYRQLIDDFHDKDFVFSRENGYPFYTIPVNVRMHRLLELTTIKKKATPHIFRHTHISMLTEAGVDVATIMNRVGHEDMETTMKIYTHVTEKMKKKAPERITNIYGNILEKITN